MGRRPRSHDSVPPVQVAFVGRGQKVVRTLALTLKQVTKKK